jgi:predicted nucleic acid-binding protein
MKILFDTNVVLDLLLARQPFVDHAAQLFASVERAEIDGYVCATTVTTIHYLLAKQVGSPQAIVGVSNLLNLFEVTPVTRAVLTGALAIKFRDFEDAVLHEAAHLSGVDAIVTRNLSDFARALLPIYDPPTLLAVLATRH